MKKSLPIVLLLLFSASVWARAIAPWSEEKMQQASDLIVIGTVKKVQDLDETNTTMWPGSKFLGVEATFAVSKVLKGDPTTRSVVLHYYRFDTTVPDNAPEFLNLKPTDTNQYLLYLVPDRAGRYAPVSGQVDPSLDAVRVDPSHNLTQQISDVLKETESIKPGMTRADLYKVFTSNGRVSKAEMRTFDYIHCPYIKVDVEFSPVRSKGEPQSDEIKTISKPYFVIDDESPQYAFNNSSIDQYFTQQMVLKEIERIKPGMTRADLLKIFTTEGGFYTGKNRTFVLVRCPYIKVDVEFAPSESKKERPTDTIAKISRPYLQWSIVD